jgi:hypothetical protein
VTSLDVDSKETEPDFFLPISPEPHPYAASVLYFRIFFSLQSFLCLFLLFRIDFYRIVFFNYPQCSVLEHCLSQASRSEEGTHYQNLTRFGEDPFHLWEELKMWHKNRVPTSGMGCCGIFCIDVTACTQFNAVPTFR